MSSVGWVVVGVMAWMALSVPLGLLVGAALRAGARVRVRPPAHVRHRVGCPERRLVARQ